MAGTQFIHVEVYGREGSKLKGAKRAKDGKKRASGSGGWSAREIMAEVLRELEASHHVSNPMKPEPIYGDVQALTEQIDALGPVPKGQRKDTPILMAGIASAPWPPGDPRSKQWRDDVLEHLKKEFGENLRVVVGHSDEPFDHLHFYVANDDFAPIKNIHHGMVAREQIKAENGAGFERKKAFDEAMRQWQNRYFVDVSVEHGHARIGPGRTRLTRADWQAQQAGNDAIAEAIKTSKITIENADKSLQKVVEEEAKSSIKQSALKASLVRLQKELDDKENDLKIQASNLEKKEQKLIEKESVLMRFANQIQKQKEALAEVFNLLPSAIQERLSKLTSLFKKPPEAANTQAAAPVPAAAQKDGVRGFGALQDVLKSSPNTDRHQKPK